MLEQGDDWSTILPYHAVAGDGAEDSFGPVLIVAYGDGTGHFGGHRVLQLAESDGEFGAQALSADLNADGELDLLLGTYGSASQGGRTAVLFGPLPK